MMIGDSFQGYFVQMNFLKDFRENNREKLSLNIADRRLDYEENKNRNLRLINLGREISGEDLFEDYDEYLNREVNDDFVIDAEIDQSLEILIDLIEIEA